MIEPLLNAENALALGLLDQAERVYRAVLEADPRNGIAAVGLARVALERGDADGAHVLAEAALEIDPANATARRMIDRLDEVARYREAAISGRAAQSSEPAAPARTPPPSSAPAPAPPTSAEPAPPTAAPNQAAPERPGLLRRILRRS